MKLYEQGFMRPDNDYPTHVVTSVVRGGTPLALVEDTWASDDVGVPAENYRVWRSPSGREMRTTTLSTSPGSRSHSAARMSDALAGAVMERLMSDGAPRDVMVAAVKEAHVAIPTQDTAVFVVDGESHSGMSATSGDMTARCAGVGDTLIIATADEIAEDIAMTLAPAGPTSELA